MLPAPRRGAGAAGLARRDHQRPRRRSAKATRQARAVRRQEGWKATTGSRSVTINGLPAHRLGDETLHCDGKGWLVEGSPDV